MKDFSYRRWNLKILISSDEIVSKNSIEYLLILIHFAIRSNKKFVIRTKQQVLVLSRKIAFKCFVEFY